MRVPCLISFSRILIIIVVGEFHLVVLAIPLMFLRFQIDSNLLMIATKFNYLNLVLLAIFP
jgi:hypothetical protein